MAVSSSDVVKKDLPVLSRFKELPTCNHVTILLVGVKGIGVDDLVKTMMETDTSYSVQLRTTTSLPLPIVSKDPRPRIDYIVFIVDLTNKQSFEIVKEAVELVDISYFIGHCCFLLSKAKQEHLHSYDISEVTSLIETYDSTMICGNLQESNERVNMVDKILHHVEIAQGFCHDVSASLLSATKQSFITGEV